MRLFVLAAAALLALVWIAVAVWAARAAPPRFDIATFHGIGILFIVPALLLAAWGRWLRPALGLLCIAAFMYLSILVVGQISS